MTRGGIDTRKNFLRNGEPDVTDRGRRRDLGLRLPRARQLRQRRGQGASGPAGTSWCHSSRPPRSARRDLACLSARSQTGRRHRRCGSRGTQKRSITSCDSSAWRSSSASVRRPASLRVHELRATDPLQLAAGIAAAERPTHNARLRVPRRSSDRGRRTRRLSGHRRTRYEGALRLAQTNVEASSREQECPITTPSPRSAVRRHARTRERCV